MNDSIVILKDDISSYINELEAEGKSHVTVRKYRRILNDLYNSLGEDKRLFKTSMLNLMEIRSIEYSSSTLNSVISAYNGFVTYLGHKDYCVSHVAVVNESDPELSRDEYLELLQTAVNEKNKRAYLLIKLFGNSNLRVHDIDAVTVEAVLSGKIITEDSKISIPKNIKAELLDFASSEEITSGPVFLNRSGGPISRSVINRLISEIGVACGIEDEKVNPRCLKKLYNKTRDDIIESFNQVIEQNYDFLLDLEQKNIIMP